MYCCQCGSGNYRKSGVIRGKQRYYCKECGYNFTNIHGRGYPPEIQIQALKLYSENMGIRSIARFLEVDPSTIMLWVRNEGQKLLRRLQQAVPRSIDGMDIIEIGSRGRKTLQKLWAKTSHLKPFAVATDEWKVYKAIIPKSLLIQTKLLTQAVEAVNGQIRNYLARFNRKTKRYSKCPKMVEASLAILWYTKLS